MSLRIITICILGAVLLSSCKNNDVGEDIPESIDARPNVVIIFTDDQGYADINTLSAKALMTPNIDTMVKEGAIFTGFYVAQPVCSASRAALLTGAYPNRVGVHGAFMPESGKGLSLDEFTLAESLQQAGYATGHFGKWHLGDDPTFMPNNQGFDTFFGIAHSNDMWPHHPWQGSVFNFSDLVLFDNEEVVEVLDDQSNLTQNLTQRSIDFIKENKNRPFFLYLAHPQPHVPLFVSDAFKGKTGQGLYADVVAELDWSVGQILQTLKEQDLDERTLVIFTSDNGPWLAYGSHGGRAEPLREGKKTVFEGGVRVPFVIRWPTQIPAGLVSDTPFMSIDLFPTIAKLAGAPLPQSKIDGLDVWSIITGKSDDNPHQAYFFYFGENELQGVRYKNWKLYFPHTYSSLNGRRGGSNGLPVDYENLTIDSIELYDMSSDPAEQQNVADKHADIVRFIETLADEMRQDLGDSLQNIPGSGRRPIGTVTH